MLHFVIYSQIDKQEKLLWKIERREIKNKYSDYESNIIDVYGNNLTANLTLLD